MLLTPVLTGQARPVRPDLSAPALSPEQFSPQETFHKRKSSNRRVERKSGKMPGEIPRPKREKAKKTAGDAKVQGKNSERNSISMETCPATFGKAHVYQGGVCAWCHYMDHRHSEMQDTFTSSLQHQQHIYHDSQQDNQFPFPTSSYPRGHPLFRDYFTLLNAPDTAAEPLQNFSLTAHPDVVTTKSAGSSKRFCDESHPIGVQLWLQQQILEERKAREVWETQRKQQRAEFTPATAALSITTAAGATGDAVDTAPSEVLNASALTETPNSVSEQNTQIWSQQFVEKLEALPVTLPSSPEPSATSSVVPAREVSGGAGKWESAYDCSTVTLVDQDAVAAEVAAALERAAQLARSQQAEELPNQLDSHKLAVLAFFTDVTAAPLVESRANTEWNKHGLKSTYTMEVIDKFVEEVGTGVFTLSHLKHFQQRCRVYDSLQDLSDDLRALVPTVPESQKLAAWLVSSDCLLLSDSTMKAQLADFAAGSVFEPLTKTDPTGAVALPSLGLFSDIYSLGHAGDDTLSYLQFLQSKNLSFRTLPEIGAAVGNLVSSLVCSCTLHISFFVAPAFQPS